MKALIETLTITGKDSNRAGEFEIGTIDVEFGHRVITVACRAFDKFVSLDGFVGRYRTSANPWLVSAHFDRATPDRVYAHFGRDDRAGRFFKERGISYEPETYAFELAKVRKENEEAAKARTVKRLAKEVVAKTKTVATSSATKYEYPEGLTAKQKQAFRAKARRAKA